MPSPWYERPLRIAALQCNFEGGTRQTLAVSDKWKTMGFNTEQLFHPMADSYSALFDVRRDGPLLKKYLARSRRNGIRIILYLNVHIIGPAHAKHAAQWAQRDRQGNAYKLYDTYDATCYNSPWRDHFWGVLDSLKPFDIHGVFLDGPVIAGDGCFCAHWRRVYRQRHGGDLRRATRPWDFQRETVHRFLTEAYARFKQVKPDGISYINLPAGHPCRYLSVRDVLPVNDLVGTEGGFMFYGPPRDAYLWHPSRAAKLLEALEPRKPRVIFMSADQKPWSWYQHAAAETKLCIASSVANAAGIWYGLSGSTVLLPTPGGEAAGDLLRALARQERWYANTESAARVGLFYSLDTEQSYQASVGESDFYGRGRRRQDCPGDFARAFQGFFDLLSRAGVPFDVVTELGLDRGDLRRYRCLLLPTIACVSTVNLERLRAFVRGGGRLVATGDTSLYDDRGRRRRDFGLADVFGVRYGGRTVDYQNWNYFVPCGSDKSLRLAGRLALHCDGRPDPLFAGVRIPLWPAPATGFVVRPRPGAEVLARFLAPLAGRYVPLTRPRDPAIVRHRLGRGQCCYLAGTFAEHFASYGPPEYRQLILNALGAAARQPVAVTGGAGNLEVVVRRQGRRLIVHLVNYAGAVPRPFERVFPQQDVTLRVRDRVAYRRARAVLGGRPCRCRRERDGLVVRVPEFAEYEVVVLE
ncbi:beta-galactosidase trimerization domain-containing protein [bacterium]|nr:beta-galactosidase trimerization domain-containing protein [bacterium]